MRFSFWQRWLSLTLLVALIAPYAAFYAPKALAATGSTGINSVSAAIAAPFLSAKKEKNDLVAILVEDSLYAAGDEQNSTSLTGKIYRYADDVRKSFSHTKTIITPLSKRTSPETIAATLEKLFLEGERTATEENHLVGVVLIGDLPLPTVEGSTEKELSSMLPYTDFVQKLFVWDPAKHLFVLNSDRPETPQPEIWHGIIAGTPGKTIDEKRVELSAYFEKNHAYHEGKLSFDKKFFFADLASESEKQSSDQFALYENAQKYNEDIAYDRYNKHWLSALLAEMYEITSKKKGVDMSLLSGFKQDFSHLPDIQSRPMIEKYLPTYGQVVENALADAYNWIDNTGRWKREDMSSSAILITLRDQFYRQLLKQTNDLFEQKIDTIVENGWAKPVPVLVTKIYTLPAIEGELSDVIYKNYFSGLSADKVVTPLDCSLLRGTVSSGSGENSLVAEANRTYDYTTAALPSTVAQYGGCAVNNLINPSACTPQAAVLPVLSLAGLHEVTSGGANFQACMVMNWKTLQTGFLGLGFGNTQSIPSSYETKNISSVVQHKEPTLSTVLAEMQGGTAPSLPSDSPRYIDFQSPTEEYEKVVYFNAFRVSGSGDSVTALEDALLTKGEEISAQMFHDLEKSYALYSEAVHYKNSKQFTLSDTFLKTPSAGYLTAVTQLSASGASLLRTVGYTGSDAEVNVSYLLDYKTGKKNLQKELGGAASLFQFALSGEQKFTLSSIGTTSSGAPSEEQIRRGAQYTTSKDENGNVVGVSVSFPFHITPVLPISPTYLLDQGKQLLSEQIVADAIAWQHLSIDEKTRVVLGDYLTDKPLVVPEKPQNGYEVGYFQGLDGVSLNASSQNIFDPMWSSLQTEAANTSGYGETHMELDEQCGPITGVDLWKWPAAVLCWLKMVANWQFWPKNAFSFSGIGSDLPVDLPAFSEAASALPQASALPEFSKKEVQFTLSLRDSQGALLSSLPPGSDSQILLEKSDPQAADFVSLLMISPTGKTTLASEKVYFQNGTGSVVIHSGTSSEVAKVIATSSDHAISRSEPLQVFVASGVPKSLSIETSSAVSPASVPVSVYLSLLDSHGNLTVDQENMATISVTGPATASGVTDIDLQTSGLQIPLVGGEATFFITPTGTGNVTIGASVSGLSPLSSSILFASDLSFGYAWKEVPKLDAASGGISALLQISVLRNGTKSPFSGEIFFRPSDSSRILLPSMSTTMRDGVALFPIVWKGGETPLSMAVSAPGFAPSGGVALPDLPRTATKLKFLNPPAQVSIDTDLSLFVETEDLFGIRNGVNGQIAITLTPETALYADVLTPQPILHNGVAEVRLRTKHKGGLLHLIASAKMGGKTLSPALLELPIRWSYDASSYQASSGQVLYSVFPGTTSDASLPYAVLHSGKNLAVSAASEPLDALPVLFRLRSDGVPTSLDQNIRMEITGKSGEIRTMLTDSRSGKLLSTYSLSVPPSSRALWRSYQEVSGLRWKAKGSGMVFSSSEGDIFGIGGDGTFGLFDNRYRLVWALASVKPTLEIRFAETGELVGDLLFTGVSLATPTSTWKRLPSGEGYILEDETAAAERSLPVTGSLESGEKGTGMKGDWKGIMAFASEIPLGEAVQPYSGVTDMLYGDPSIRLKPAKDENAIGYDKTIGKELYTSPHGKILKVVPFDFNGDKKTDLAVATKDGFVSVLEGTNDGRMRDRWDLAFFFKDITTLAAGDFENDGKEDLIAASGDGNLRLMLNQNKRFSPAKVPISTGAKEIRELQTLDFDGDGKLDIAISDSRSRILVFWGDGKGGFTAGNIVADYGMRVDSTKNLASEVSVGTKVSSSFSAATSQNGGVPDTVPNTPEGLAQFDAAVASLGTRKRTDPGYSSVMPQVTAGADAGKQATAQIQAATKQQLSQQGNASVTQTQVLATPAGFQAFANSMGTTMPTQQVPASYQFSAASSDSRFSTVAKYAKAVDVTKKLDIGSEVFYTISLTPKQNLSGIAIGDTLAPMMELVPGSLACSGCSGTPMLSSNMEGIDVEITGLSLTAGKQVVITYKAKVLDSPTVLFTVKQPNGKVSSWLPDAKAYETAALETTANTTIIAPQRQISSFPTPATPPTVRTTGIPEPKIPSTISDMLRSQWGLDPSSQGRTPVSFGIGGQQVSLSPTMNDMLAEANSSLLKAKSFLQNLTCASGGCLALPINYAFFAPGTIGGISQITNMLGSAASGVQDAAASSTAFDLGADSSLFSLSESISQLKDSVTGIGEAIGLPSGFDIGMPVFGMRLTSSVCPGDPPMYAVLPGTSNLSNWIPGPGLVPPCFTGIMNVPSPSDFRIYISPTLTGGVGLALCVGPTGSPLNTCFATATTIPFVQGLCDKINDLISKVASTASAVGASTHGSKVFGVDGLTSATKSGAGGVTYGVELQNFKIKVLKPGQQKHQKALFEGFLQDWWDRQLREVNKLFNLPVLSVILPDWASQFKTVEKSQENLQNRISKVWSAGGGSGVGGVGEMAVAGGSSDQQGQKSTLDQVKALPGTVSKSVSDAADKLTAQGKAAADAAKKSKQSVEEIYEWLNQVPFLVIERKNIEITVPWISPSKLKSFARDMQSWQDDANKELMRATDDWTGIQCDLEKAKKTAASVPAPAATTPTTKAIDKLKSGGSSTAELLNLQNCQAKEIGDKILVDTRKLISSMQQNQEVLRGYAEFPLQIVKYKRVFADYIGGVTRYLASINDMMGGWSTRNRIIVQKYIEVYITIKTIIQLFANIESGFKAAKSSCKACQSPTWSQNMTLTSILGMIVPDLPVIEFPRWPDVVFDLSEVQEVKVSVPTLDWRIKELQIFDLPRLRLPRAPTTSFVLPALPILPKLPNLPNLPAFPTLPIPRLPDLPPPPKLPTIPGSITSAVSLVSTALQIYCLITSGMFVYPETTLKPTIEAMTNRPTTPFLSLDFLKLQFPKITYPWIDEIRATVFFFPPGVSVLVDAIRNVAKEFNKLPNSLIDSANERVQQMQQEMESTLQQTQIFHDTTIRAKGVEQKVEQITTDMNDPLRKKESDLQNSASQLLLPGSQSVKDGVNTLNQKSTEVQQKLEQKMPQGFVPSTVEMPRWGISGKSRNSIAVTRNGSESVAISAAETPQRGASTGQLQALFAQLSSLQNAARTASSLKITPSAAEISAQMEKIPQYEKKKGESMEKRKMPVETRFIASQNQKPDLVPSVSAAAGSSLPAISYRDPKTLPTQIQQLSANPPISYNGIYIANTAAGVQERLTNYVDESYALGAMFFADLNNDGREEVLYSYGNDLYMKENRLQPVSLQLYSNSPIIKPFADLIPNRPSVNNFKISGLGNGSFSVSWSADPAADLGAYLITLKHVVDGFDSDIKNPITTENILFVPESSPEGKLIGKRFSAGSTLFLLGSTVRVEDGESLQIERLSGESASFQRPNGFYYLTIQSISQHGFISTIAPTVLAAPQVEADTEAPLLMMGAEKRVPILKKNTIAANGLLEDSQFLSVGWDIGMKGKITSTGSALTLPPYDEPKTDRVGLVVADGAGNRATKEVAIDAFAPGISISGSRLDENHLFGSVEPRIADMPFVLIRKRGNEYQLIRTKEADANGRYHTKADGTYDVSGFDQSQDIEIKSALGNSVALLHAKNGRIELLDPSYSIGVEPSTETLPLRQVVKTGSGEVLASVLFVTSQNVDVSIDAVSVTLQSAKKLIGVHLFDRSSSDAIQLFPLPGDAPMFPGGAVVVDMTDPKNPYRIATIGRAGEVRFEGASLGIRLKATKNLDDPVIFEVMKGEKVLFELFIESDFQKVEIGQTGSRQVAVRSREAVEMPRRGIFGKFYNSVTVTRNGSESVVISAAETPQRGASTFTLIPSAFAADLQSKVTSPFALSGSSLVSPFPDLKPDNPAYAAIMELYNRKILKGYEDGLVRPDAKITRAEFVKIALGATQCADCTMPTPDDIKEFGAKKPFPDVFKPAWYFYCVSKGKKEKMIQGYGDGLFRAEKNISRAEAAAVILRQAKIPIEKAKGQQFFDVTPDMWFANEVYTAVQLGLIPSHKGFTFPMEEITRGEFAMMAKKVLELRDCQDLSSGKTTEHGKVFPPLPESCKNVPGGCPQLWNDLSLPKSPEVQVIPGDLCSFPEYKADIRPNDEIYAAIVNSTNTKLFSKSEILKIQK